MNSCNQPQYSWDNVQMMMTTGDNTIDFDFTIIMGEVWKEKQCNTQLVWDPNRKKKKK